MRSKSRLSAVLIVGLLLGLGTSAQALDRGKLGALSPSNPLIQKTFPGLAGQPPANALFAEIRQENCRKPASTYCDVHEFTVTVPKDYPFIHSMVTTLRWPETTAVNLDLYIYNNDTSHNPQNAVTGPAYGASSGAGRHPEQVVSSEPETGTYWIVVVKRNALPNANYTITLEWTTVDLGDVPTGRRPIRATGGGDSSTAPTARPPAFTGFDTGDEASGDQPRTIKVPGPDGELIEMTLPTYERAAQQRGGLNPIIPVLIAVLLVGAGTGVFFFFRARREQTET